MMKFFGVLMVGMWYVDVYGIPLQSQTRVNGSIGEDGCRTCGFSRILSFKTQSQWTKRKIHHLE